MVAPSLEVSGGQSVQAARLLTHLQKEPSVDASLLRTDTPLRGPLRPLRAIRYARTLARFPLYVASLATRVPKCDVIHVFAASYWSFVLNPMPAILLGRLFRKKVLVNYHSGEAPEHLARSSTAVRALRQADAIVVQSAFLEEAFARVGLATTVIPNHVDLGLLPFRARRPIKPRFLTTRALEPGYGVATVLRAFALIQKQFPDAALRIVGDGGGRAELEMLSRELRLRAVTFSGALDSARMPEVYDTADVLLNGSTTDSMPLTFLEAFASGLPVVSTAAGGIPFLVTNEKTGLLVPLDDPSALAVAAVRLLRDDDLACRLAGAARDECSRYSWPATGPGWLTLYDQLGAGGPQKTYRRWARGRSHDELRVRATQACCALRDRAGVLRRGEPRADEMFTNGHTASDGLLDRFRAREEALLSPAFANRARTASELHHRFAGTTGPELIAHADRIVAGRFDLLGFRDLSFGSPIDWHLDPVSGDRFPLVHWSRFARLDERSRLDRKIVWELNRHQSFVVLGRAYWLTGDERYAAAFAQQLTEWIEQNPAGVGVNWSSSLEVALRLVSWTWAISLFRDSPQLTQGLFLHAMKLVGLQARHVATYTSTYSSPNTHLTGEALGLYCVGTCWPELREAAAWRKAGLDVLLSSLDRQVTADGVYFERSTAYHLYTIDFYAHLVACLTASGDEVPRLVRDGLTALFDHLLYVTRPDGTIPLLGDDDGGRLLPLDERLYADARPTLALGAALLDRPEYKAVGRDASEEMLWLLGADALLSYDRLVAEPPTATSRAFRAGGIYVLRDGWSETASAMTIDCGEHGGGHDHAGALGFDLSALGRPVLIDPGTHSYLRGHERGDPFRSTAAHNTVVVDEHSSSLPAGPFSWGPRARGTLRAWSTVRGHDFFEGSHDGYHRLADPVTHIRSILLAEGGCWVIRDRLVAAATHRYDLGFHFAPDVQLTLDDTRSPSVLREARFQIVTFGPGAWQLSTARVSRRYGAQESAQVATRTAHAKGPQEFITFLLPRNEATVVEVPAATGRAFELRDAKSHRVFAISDSRWTLETLEPSCAE